MTRAKKRKLMRPDGNCYRIALEALLDLHRHDPDGAAACRLVHGQVWSVLLNRHIEHAWVWIPAGVTVTDATNDRETFTHPVILDLTLKKEHRLLPDSFFQKAARPIEHLRYTLTEAAALSRRFRVWGPWHPLLARAPASASPQEGSPCHSPRLSSSDFSSFFSR